MLVPGANTGILASRRNRSSETEHEWPGPQGAGARSGRETGFEKSLSPPKTHKRDTDLPQCFSSGDSGRRASGSPAVCAQVSTGPKMRGARLDHAADCCPAAAPRAPVRHLLRWPEAGSRRDPKSHRTGRSSSAPANRTSIRSASTATPSGSPARRPPRGDRPAPRPRSAAPSVRSSPAVGPPRMPSSSPAVWKDPAMVVRYAASVSTREGAVSRYVPALFRPMRPGHKGEDPSPVPE